MSGIYVDPRAGKITFTSFYRDWSKRQIWQATTVLAMDLAAKSVPFGDLALNKVRKSHIEQWVKSMQVAGLAPGTVRGRFEHVRRIFHAAIDDRLIALDPTRGVRLPAKRCQEAAMEIPTPDEVSALLEEAADDDFAVYIALCAFAGLRLGEAAGIQVGDVDFLRRTLRIARQVQRITGGGVEIRAPKYNSERTNFLPDDLLAMLSELIKRRGIEQDRETFLFTGTGINPPHANQIWHRWKPLCRRTGVETTIHNLRHFYASGLIASGCDVVTVSRALGHRSPAVTLRVYAHLWPTAEDKTRAAAAQLMASAITPRGPLVDLDVNGSKVRRTSP